MNVTSRFLAVVIPAVMILTVVTGNLVGWWQTESSKQPVTFSAEEYDGEFAGEANPADIRGSYSLSDIEAAFGVPIADMAAAFQLDGEETPGTVLLKEFEERFGVLPAARADSEAEYEIGTDAMRLFVARYRGLPYEPETDTGILDTALAVLTDTVSLPDELRSELERRVVKAPSEEASEDPGADDTEVSATVLVDGDADDEYTVKGNTTFGELLTWGVPETEIRAVLDGEIGARGEQVRTWCIDRGITYADVKDRLQTLVDEAVE